MGFSVASRVIHLCLLFLLAGRAVAQPVSLQQAVDLALKNSNAIKIAQADLARSRAGLRELRDAYIPALYLTSSAGKAFGFPLGAPEVFDLSSQSSLFSLTQRQYIRAARAEIGAAEFTSEDTRRQIILDTATTYAELNKLLSGLEVLQEEQQAAARMEELVHKRVEAGIETKTEITRAELGSARVRLRLAEFKGSTDLLRKHLSELTGLPQDSIETEAESIPAFPTVDQSADLGQKALENNPAVKAADRLADAKDLRALGEHKQNLPTVDFFSQYGLFSNYNNANQYYAHPLQINNFSIGVQIKFPFFNASQRAHAASADADALRARKEAVALRQQLSSETLRLQRLVAQLQESVKVAQLEYELAQADLEALKIKAQSSSGPAATASGGDITPKELESAQIAVGEKYSAVLDASFELDRVQLQLLRQTGDLEKWATLSKP